MGSHKTLKVRTGTWDRVQSLAEQSGESIGSVADAMLSGAVDDFREMVQELAKVPVTEPRFNITTRKPVPAKVTAKGAAEGAGKGAAEGAGKGAPQGAA